MLEKGMCVFRKLNKFSTCVKEGNLEQAVVGGQK